jgi:bacterioferritin (cytochrome b1)
MTFGCKANAETVIRLLNEALAAEILCILRYNAITSGPAGSVLAT